MSFPKSTIDDLTKKGTKTTQRIQDRYIASCPESTDSWADAKPPINNLLLEILFDKEMWLFHFASPQFSMQWALTWIKDSYLSFGFICGAQADKQASW